VTVADYKNPNALVSPERLAKYLEHVKVVDGSWYLPAMQRDPVAEFAEAHIPGAVYFDIETIADQSSDLPHTLPSAEQFAEQVGALGISNDDPVVIYDGLGLFSSGRVWWMFKYFGHERVSILDGGFTRWQAEGHPVEDGAATPASATYSATANADMAKALEDMRGNIDSAAAQVLDARSAGRFNATEPEPRAGLRNGHIPGSFSLPVSDLTDPETKCVKSADALTSLFDEAGVDFGRPSITTCGSGVSACAVAFALHLMGKDDVAMYDGSWTEWGGRDDTPVAP
jgi:thiosulfate/3-mercaptopyruvate sulfurtransferase